MLAININPSNAPRDLEELKKLPRSTLLRVALAANIWANDAAAESAFMAANHEEMAGALLQGLLRWDAGRAGGVAPAAMVAPQQVATPPQAMMPVTQPAVPRQPVTATDPGNNGAAPGIPAGMAPAPAPMPMAAAAPTGQAPPTTRAPQPAQEPVGGQVLTVLLNLSKSIDSLRKTVDEEVPGIGEHEEIRDLVVGLANIVQVNTMMVLMLCERVLEVPRDVLIKMVGMELEDSQRLIREFSSAAGEASAGKT